MVGFSHIFYTMSLCPSAVAENSLVLGIWHFTFHSYFWYRKFNVFKLCHWWWWGGVGTKRCDSWDPSQQIQGLKCPSQPNPNKNNIETCSVKLPPLFQIELNGFQTFFNVLMNHVGKWDKDIIDELW